MKIGFPFDSCKACLAVYDVCVAAKESVLSVYPNAEVVSVPPIDGGEGAHHKGVPAHGGRELVE